MKCALSVLTLVVASALPLAGSAQPTWPSHTVRIIATSPPGGSVDFLSRALAEDFSRTFGAPFVVESRPGANGNIGVDLVVKAPADGHMLFVAPPGPFAINAHLMDFMPFNPATDVAPVAMLGVAPLVLVVHPSVPAKDLRELLAWLRGEGAHAHYASQAVASTGDLRMEVLNSRARGGGAPQGEPRHRGAPDAARAVRRIRARRERKMGGHHPPLGSEGGVGRILRSPGRLVDANKISAVTAPAIWADGTGTKLGDSPSAKDSSDDPSVTSMLILNTRRISATQHSRRHAPASLSPSRHK